MRNVDRAEDPLFAPRGCTVCDALPGVRHIDGCPNIGANAPELASADPWGDDG